MAKYANYAQLQAEAPEKLRRKATPDAFQGGLRRVAPPGRTPRPSRVENYGRGVERGVPNWLPEWTEAMFG